MMYPAASSHRTEAVPGEPCRTAHPIDAPTVIRELDATPVNNYSGSERRMPAAETLTTQQRHQHQATRITENINLGLALGYSQPTATGHTYHPKSVCETHPIHSWNTSSPPSLKPHRSRTKQNMPTFGALLILHSILLVTSGIIPTIHRVSAADPSVPTNFTTVTASSSFTNTAVFAMEGVTFDANVEFVISLKSTMYITEDVILVCNNCTIRRGALFQVVADGIQAPLRVSIMFDNLLVSGGGLMFAGSFPENTVIFITQSVFMADGGVMWPSTIRDLLSSADRAPTLLFVENTFLGGSVVAIHNNLFVGNDQISTNGLTMVAFAGSLVLDHAYVHFAGAVFSPLDSDGTGTAITVCTSDDSSSTLELTNKAVMHFEGISFSDSSSANGLVFGYIESSGYSTVAIEGVSAKVWSLLIYFMGDVALSDHSALFVRNVESFGTDVVVYFDAYVVLSNSSFATFSEIRATAPTSQIEPVYFVIEPTVDAGTTASHVLGICLFSGSNEFSSDVFGFTNATDCTDTCEPSFVCSNAGGTLYASPVMSSSVRVGCSCVCDGTLGDGRRCFPFMDGPTRSTAAFVFPRDFDGNSIVSAMLYTGAAFSGMSLAFGDALLADQTTLQIEPCVFSRLTETFTLASMVRLDGLTVQAGSFISVSSCLSSNPVEAAVLLQLPPASIDISNSMMTDSVIMLANDFPFASIIRVTVTRLFMPDGGMYHSCNVISGNWYYGALFLCALHLQYTTTLFVRDVAIMSSSDTYYPDALMIADGGSGIVIESNSQLIVFDVHCNANVIGSLALFDAGVGAQSLQVTQGSVAFFTQLFLTSYEEHFWFKGHVVVESTSMLAFDRLWSEYYHSQPLIIDMDLVVTSDSWMLLRNMDILGESRVLGVLGSTAITSRSVLTLASIVSTATYLEVDMFGSADSTSEFVTNCLLAQSIIETTLYTSSMMPIHYSCGSCTVSASCFAALTTALDTSCGCSCSASGHTALCLPIQIEESSMVVTPNQNNQPPPGPPATNGPSSPSPTSGPAPPSSNPYPVYDTETQIDVLANMSIENATVRREVVLSLQQYVSAAFVEVVLHGWKVERGAALVVRGSYNGFWNGTNTTTTSGGKVSIRFSQMYFEGGVMLVIGHMPQGITLEWRDCMFLTAADLSNVAWGAEMRAFFGPMDHGPSVLFYEFILTNGSSAAFFNTIIINANRTTPTTLLSFVGDTLLFGSEFVLDGFSATGSSNFATSNIMTVSYQMASPSMSPVSKPTLQFPSGSSGQGCPRNVFLLAGGSVFRIANGQVPAMNGYGFVFGCTAVYDHSALVFERVSAFLLPEALFRMEEGVFMDLHSWWSVRNIESSGAVLSIEANSSAVYIDASSGISLSSLQSYGPELIEIGYETLFSWTVATAGRTRSMAYAQCNFVNRTDELDAPTTEYVLLDFTTASGLLHYTPCMTAPSSLFLAQLGVATPAVNCTTNASSALCNPGLFCSAANGPVLSTAVNVTSGSNNGFTVGCACRTAAYTTDGHPVYLHGPQCLPTTRSVPLSSTAAQGGALHPPRRHSAVLTFHTPYRVTFPNFPFTSVGPPAFMGLDVDGMTISGVMVRFDVCGSPRYLHDPSSLPSPSPETTFTIHLSHTYLQPYGRFVVASCSNGSIASPSSAPHAHTVRRNVDSALSPMHIIPPLDVAIVGTYSFGGALGFSGDLPAQSTVVLQDTYLETTSSAVPDAFCGPLNEYVFGFVVLCSIRVQGASMFAIQGVMYSIPNVLQRPVASGAPNTSFGYASNGVATIIALANGIVVADASQFIVDSVMPVLLNADRMLAVPVIAVVALPSALTPTTLSSTWVESQAGIAVLRHSLFIIAGISGRMNRTSDMAIAAGGAHKAAIYAPVLVNGSILLDNLSLVAVVDVDNEPRTPPGDNLSSTSPLEIVVNQSTIAVRGSVRVTDRSWLLLQRVAWHPEIPVLSVGGPLTFANTSRASMIDCVESGEYFPDGSAAANASVLAPTILSRTAATLDASSSFVVKCNLEAANAVVVPQVVAPAGGTYFLRSSDASPVPPVVYACTSKCNVNTSCPPALAVGIDSDTCTCSCAAEFAPTYGPVCLPVDVFGGLDGILLRTEQPTNTPFIEQHKIRYTDLTIPPTDFVLMDHVTFTQNVIVVLKLSRLYPQSSGGTGELLFPTKGIEIEFVNCHLIAALLDIVGFTSGPSIDFLYNDESYVSSKGIFANRSDTVDSSGEGSMPWLLIRFTNVTIHAGSTILFRGRFPPNTTITFTNLATLDNISTVGAANMASRLPGSVWYSYDVTPPILMAAVVLVESQMLIQNATFRAVNAEATMPAFYAQDHLYLVNATLTFEFVVFFSAAKSTKAPLLIGNGYLFVDAGAAFTLINVVFNASSPATTTTPLYGVHFDYGVDVRYYGSVVFQSVLCEYCVRVNYAYLEHLSRLVFDGVVSQTSNSVMCDGTLSIYSFSHLSISNVTTANLIAGGSWNYSPATARVSVRCAQRLSLASGNITREVLTAATMQDLGLGDVNVATGCLPATPSQCNWAIECFGPLTDYSYAAQDGGGPNGPCHCKCLAGTPSVIADQRFCFMRRIPQYQGSTLFRALGLQDAPSGPFDPSKSQTSCSVAAAAPSLVQSDSRSPTFPYTWLWKLRLDRTVRYFEGVSLNGEACDTSASDTSSFTSHVLPSALEVGPSEVTFNILSCGNAFWKLFQGVLNITSMRVEGEPFNSWEFQFQAHIANGLSLVSLLTIPLSSTDVTDLTWLFFPPRIDSASGCLVDAFPSTFRCAVDGTVPITIHGANFPVDILNVTLEFYQSRAQIPSTIVTAAIASDLHPKAVTNPVGDQPASNDGEDVEVVPPIKIIPCTNWTVVSNATIVCHNMTGRGELAVVAVKSRFYGTVRSQSATVSFVPDLSALCPHDINSERCGGHGTCNPNTGTCTCESSTLVGFWDGAACDRCHVNFNSSESAQCLQPCPVDDSGNICGGSGYCVGGSCVCGDFVSTGVCNDDCPGINGVCSGHGVCNTAYGTCECFYDGASGFFVGDDCASCDPAYSGDDCTKPCPIGAETQLPCNGNGTCFDGVCYCVSTACGIDCSVNRTTTATLCEACPYPSQYGFNCAFTCPGSSNPFDVCSGHGSCNSGPYGTGSCLCEAGYGGPSCSTECPSDETGALCSGHGTCDRTFGTCLCDRTFGGSACANQCPSINGIVCGTKGTCDEGSSNTGKCVCTAGYSGPACNVSCFGEALPCSGHGLCQSSGTCSCFEASSTGHWGGSASCNSCTEGWVGASCNLQCTKGPNGLPCSGRGFCNNLLRCQCYESSATGFWGGDVCEVCAYGYSGHNCSTPCDGGVCAPCNLNGICNPLNGSCACYADSTRGYWNKTTACASCTALYYGDRCQQKCPSCQHGYCLDGQYGNGTCVCNDRYALNSSGVCSACAPGYYGAQCTLCSDCSGHGTCLDGIARNGSCVCGPGYAGVACNFLCNISAIDGRLCGNGTCTGTGVCTCATNFTRDVNLTCSACKAGLFGDACNRTCPPCARGTCRRNGTCACPTGYFGVLCDRVCPGGSTTPCSLHGSCHPLSGLCTCSASLSTGFYTGTDCSSCAPAYASTHCNISCPFSADGGVCSARGVCHNGACTQCAPRRNETSSLFLVCGASCNQTNSECLSFGFSCPLGFFGTLCNNTCPATIVSSTTNQTISTCSGHGICSPVNGSCFCFAGYFGLACDFACPSGYDSSSNLTLPCSGRGVCKTSGQCTCVSGFWGGACQLECPGGSEHPCSGRGTCGFDGRCTCAYGALGAACAEECPHGFESPCNRRGLCDPDAGQCTCFNTAEAGFWAGSNCTDCAPSFGGVGCNIPCPSDRGAVIDGVCVCLSSFTGEDCSLVCPTPQAGEMGAGLVCGGRGTCSAVKNTLTNVTSATCTCAANYFGPTCQIYCSSALCKITTSFYRPQCNPTTGECECETSPGIWVGTTCSVCAASRWGSECNQICTCSGNGVCDQTSGECQCFADSNNGYWAGFVCDVCKSGYVGARCQTANIALASQGEDTAVGTVTNTTAFLSAPSWCAFLDVSSLTLWTAGDQTSLKLINLTSSSVQTSIDVGGVAIDCFLFDDTHVAVIVLELETDTELLKIVDLASPFTVHADVAPVAHRRFLDLATDPVILLKQVSRSGFTCDLFGSRTTKLLSMARCTLANTTVLSTSIDPPIRSSWASIILLDNAPELDTRWQLIITSATSGTVWMWNLARNSSTTASTAAVGDGAQTTDVVAIKLCSTNAQDIDALYCAGTIQSTKDTSLLDVVMVALRVTTHSVRSVSRLEIGLSPTTTVTTLMVDASFGLALLAHNTPSTASTILTVRVTSWNSTNGIEEVAVIGTQDLPQLQIALSLAIEGGGRTLMVIAMRFSSISVLRYNLFGVLRVWPTIVDTNGGAVLHIYGEGFPVGGSVSTLCITGGIASPATVLNQTTLTCVVQAASETSGGMCDVEFVNVMLGNTSSDTKTVGVRRPVPAIVSTVTTDAGSIGFGPSRFSIGLKVEGFGFVASDSASCRIVNRTTRAEIARSTATVLSSSAALCRQPIAPPSAIQTCVEYSHDGFYFGSSSCAPYQIVGDFGGVEVGTGSASMASTHLSASSVSTVTNAMSMRAAAVVKFPDFFVATKDRYGNPRGPFEDTTNLRIRCSTLHPSIAITDQVPEELSFTSNTSLTVAVSSGVADYAQTFVVAPAVGTYTLYCFAVLDTTLFSTASVVITTGVPAASTIQLATSWFVGVTKKSVLLPNPTLLLLDAAGNKIQSDVGIPVNAILQYQLLDPLRPDRFTTQKLVTFARSDGEYIFENIAMQSVFGVDTPLSFFVDGVPPTVLSIPHEICQSPTEYAVKGTTNCAPCPDSGICDGTSFVMVRAGYWRPSIYSYTFYSCTPSDACPATGAECAEGYHGNLCSECSEGYGWSVNHCASCDNPHVNRLLIAILLIGFVGVVFYMSVITMPITSVFDTMYLSALEQKSPVSVIAKLLVSHFQVVALIPFSKLSLPGWFTQFFLIAQSGSSVNPNLSFISCEIGDGLVNNILLSISLCPILIGIVAILCLGAAWWTARRFTKAAYESVFVERNITEKSNIHRFSEYVAQGDAAHVSEVQRSHFQFFEEEEEGAHATTSAGEEEMSRVEPSRGVKSHVTFDSALVETAADFSKPSADDRAAEEAIQEHEKAANTLQSKKDLINRSPRTFFVRWVNMVALATIVVLFVLLPSIIEFSASMLQCTEVDFGNGVFKKLVTSAPSIECSGAEYASTTNWVWAVIILFGLGVPALNVLFVKALARWTCGGNQFVAQDILFFATGGYSRSMWFWESISLARKAILVLGSTLLSEERMQVLWCVWFLILSVVLNIVFRPWASSLLSNVELFSLSALALTFGIAEILLLVPDDPNATSSRNAMIVGVVIVNVIAIGVFFVAGLWFVKDLTIELAHQGNNVFADVFDNKKRAIRKRRDDIRSYLARLHGIHGRFSVLSELELFVDRVKEEAEEHARNTANYAEFIGLSDLTELGAHGLKVMQGGVYKSQRYRQRRDATPHVIDRYTSKENFGRSTAISKLLSGMGKKSGVPSSATNPLSQPAISISISQDAVPGEDAHAIELHDIHSARFGATPIASPQLNDSLSGAPRAAAGMDAFCGIVADMLRRTNQQPQQPVEDGFGGYPAFDPSITTPVERSTGRPGDALEFKHVAVAFEDLWEMWAYWTSIAESCSNEAAGNGTSPLHLVQLVESRMLELFEIEEKLLVAIVLLCEKVRRDQQQ